VVEPAINGAVAAKPADVLLRVGKFVSVAAPPQRWG
jgi:hypothetical protein